jgi:hypothetical protein
MIVKFNQAFISVARLRDVGTNNLFTQYAAGAISALQFQTALDGLATQLAATAKTPSKWLSQVTIGVDGIEIVLDHPFGMNSVVAAVEAGSVSALPMTVGSPYQGKKTTRNLQTLTSGSWAITAACSYIGAKAQQIMHANQPELFKTGRRESAYIAARQRLDQEIAKIATIDGISCWLPEEIGVVEDGIGYIHRPVDLTIASGFAESVSYADLPATVSTKVSFWLEKARVTARLSPTLIGATNEQLDTAFSEVGVGYWMSANLPWIKVKSDVTFDVLIDPYTLDWMETYSRYCVGILSYYSRWFQSGTHLSDDEVAAMTTQWVLMLKKFGISGTWDMTSQFDSTYELYHAMLRHIDNNWVNAKSVSAFAYMDMLSGKIPFSSDVDIGTLTAVERSEVGVIMSLNRVGFDSWPIAFKNRVQSFNATGFIYNTSTGKDIEIKADGTSPFSAYLYVAWSEMTVREGGQALHLHITRLNEICNALMAATNITAIQTNGGTHVRIDAAAARWIQNMGPYYQPWGVAYVHPGYKL